MKVIQTIALGLTGLVATVSSAQAQEAKAPTLDVVVQFGNKKPAKLTLDKAPTKNKFIYTDKLSEQQMEGSISQTKTFMIQSPADLVAAMRNYRAGKIEAAAKRLAAVKAKYKDFVGLPGNPTHEAALTELMCNVRLANWAGLKANLASFPSAATLEDHQKPLVLVCKFLAVEDAAAASQLEAIDALMEKKAAVDKFDLSVYGLLRLAQARGLAAQVPAGELEAGTLSTESAAIATKAADYFCEAAMAQRGANPEIMHYAMVRAAKLLWAMPGVQEYVGKLDGAKACTDSQWKSAPANFKDAAALAKFASGVFTVENEDPAIIEMAGYYTNINKGEEAK